MAELRREQREKYVTTYSVYSVYCTRAVCGVISTICIVYCVRLYTIHEIRKDGLEQCMNGVRIGLSLCLPVYI